MIYTKIERVDKTPTYLYDDLTKQAAYYNYKLFKQYKPPTNRENYRYYICPSGIIVICPNNIYIGDEEDLKGLQFIKAENEKIVVNLEF